MAYELFIPSWGFAQVKKFGVTFYEFFMLFSEIKKAEKAS